MLIELILIGFSVLIIMLLVTVRYFKFSYAKGGTSSFLNKTDNKIYSFWLLIKRIYSETANDISELIKDIPHLVLHFLNRILYRLYKKTKKLVDLIKGNRIKTNRGAVSLYLKRINEDVEEVKIESVVVEKED